MVWLPVFGIFNVRTRYWCMRLHTGAVRTLQESRHWKLTLGLKKSLAAPGTRTRVSTAPGFLAERSTSWAIPAPIVSCFSIAVYKQNVSRPRCRTLRAGRPESRSLSAPFTQCRSSRKPFTQCRSSSLPYTQCRSSSLPYTQCRSYSLPYTQCRSSSLPYTQCRSSSLPYIQCRSYSLPHTQCRSYSLPYTQCRSSSLPYTQYRSSSLPYTQCMPSRLPRRSFLVTGVSTDQNFCLMLSCSGQARLRQLFRCHRAGPTEAEFWLSISKLGQQLVVQTVMACAQSQSLITALIFLTNI